MIDYGLADDLVDDRVLVHCHLIELETPVATQYLNTSGWKLSWDGKTWMPGDGIQEIRLPAENPNLDALKATVVIPALDPATTSLALTYNMQGRYIAIWHAIFDPETFQIVDTARLFSGRVSHLSLKKPPVDG